MLKVSAQLRRYGVAGLVTVLALLLDLVLELLMEVENPFLLFFGAIAFSTWYGGLEAGLLATLAAGLLSYYTFADPHYSLLIARIGSIALPSQLKQTWHWMLAPGKNLQLGLFLLEGALFSYAIDARSFKQQVEKSIGCMESAVLLERAPDISTNVNPAVLGDGELEKQVARINELKQANAKLEEELVEHRRLVETLHRREREFKTLVENAPDAIARFDRELRYTYVNSVVERVLGLSRQSIIGKTNSELPLPEKICEFWEENICKVLATALEREIEFQFETAFGVRSYQARLVPECDSEGATEYVLVVSRDITENKRLETERSQLIRSEAERDTAQILERRSAFLSEASTVLASSLDYETTTKNVGRLGVPFLADYCLIHKLKADRQLRLATAIHRDPQQQKLIEPLLPFERISIDNPKSLIARVMRTGEPLLVDGDAISIELTQDRRLLEIYRELAPKSLIILPLIARRQVFGTITLAVANISERRYDASDLALAEDFAYRAAVAIDNARLYRNTQQALQRQAELLSQIEALLAGAPLAVCFLDRELRYVRINQVMAEINGFSIERHLGRRFGELLPDMAVRFEAQLQQVIDTGEALLNVEINGEAPGKPGRFGYWLGNYYPVRDADGKTVGVGIILADITATKQAQEALRESEERFRAMFAQAAVGIAQASLDGRFVLVNPAMCDITGYSQDELLQMTIEEISHPEEQDLDIASFQRVIAREIDNYSLEKRFFRKDGSIFWVNVTASAVWNSQGEPKYGVGIVEDINERKLAEAARQFLVESSMLLAASLDYETTLANVARLSVPTLGDWCIVDVFKPDWSIEQLAVACKDAEKREIIQQLRHCHPHPLLPRLRRGKSTFKPHLSEAMMKAIALNEEHLQILRSLEIKSIMVIPLLSRSQVFGSLSFVLAESNRCYTAADLALAEDIARRAAIAIDNARLYHEAQEANRLKDEFLAVLSHELRTPLNSILGWSQLLRTRKSSAENTERALETIERNARLQTQLIEDLLDISRITQGKLNLKRRRVNLVTIIEAAIHTVRLTADAKEIQIKSTFASALWPIYGDSDRLQQVFWNLLSNAIKFTPNGGKVEVQLSAVMEENSQERENYLIHYEKFITRNFRSYAQIQISDTGKGIRPDFLPYVFDRFRQADGAMTRTEGGLGLGLAIVRHLVQMHDGTVEAQSDGEGLGSTFTVRLPLVEDSHPDPAIASNL